LNRLKKQLLNLAIGELAALCTFIFVYRLLNLGMASKEVCIGFTDIY